MIELTTVRLALAALLLVDASFDCTVLAGIVLVSTASAPLGASTVAVIVQVPPVAMVAPVIETCVAVPFEAAGPQPASKVGPLNTVRPPGRLSVNATPVSANAAEGLVTLMVNVAWPPAGTVVGLNAFVSVAFTGARTCRVALKSCDWNEPAEPVAVALVPGTVLMRLVSLARTPECTGIVTPQSGLVWAGFDWLGTVAPVNEAV